MYLAHKKWLKSSSTTRVRKVRTIFNLKMGSEQTCLVNLVSAAPMPGIKVADTSTVATSVKIRIVTAMLGPGPKSIRRSATRPPPTSILPEMTVDRWRHYYFQVILFAKAWYLRTFLRRGWKNSSVTSCAWKQNIGTTNKPVEYISCYIQMKPNWLKACTTNFITPIFCTCFANLLKVRWFLSLKISEL